MNNKFETPSESPKTEKNEEVIITDSDSYKEAIKNEDYEKAAEIQKKNWET